jgi:hypothetical protein
VSRQFAEIELVERFKQDCGALAVQITLIEIDQISSKCTKLGFDVPNNQKNTKKS